MGDLTFHK